MLPLSDFKDLNYQTQLLESVGWDESQLAALFDYLETVFNSDIVVHPEIILSTIEENFGEDTKECFKKIFNTVMLNYNLHTSTTDEN